MTTLPSLKAIERGLSQATERFATDLAGPLPIAPSWSDFEWQMARAAAILHGIGPLLAGTLQWAGPTGWQPFLREERSQTLLRSEHMAAALQEIEAQAVAREVALVALKGTALHALGIYAPGERPMADIDLLVRPVDTERAAQLLTSVGYTQTSVTWKHRVFERAHCARALLPPGDHQGYPLKVELHERIVERLPRSETDITALVFPLSRGLGSILILQPTHCCCTCCCMPPARCAGVPSGSCTCTTFHGSLPGRPWLTGSSCWELFPD